MLTHIMKTTIELPDALLIEAKATAARRRTTLKAMMEHALRREIQSEEPLPDDSPFELDEYGFPVLKREPDTPVMPLDYFKKIQEQIDLEDAERAWNPIRKSQ